MITQDSLVVLPDEDALFALYDDERVEQPSELDTMRESNVVLQQEIFRISAAFQKCTDEMEDRMDGLARENSILREQLTKTQRQLQHVESAHREALRTADERCQALFEQLSELPPSGKKCHPEVALKATDVEKSDAPTRTPIDRVFPMVRDALTAAKREGIQDSDRDHLVSIAVGYVLAEAIQQYAPIAPFKIPALAEMRVRIARTWKPVMEYGADDEEVARWWANQARLSGEGATLVLAKMPMQILAAVRDRITSLLAATRHQVKLKDTYAGGAAIRCLELLSGSL